MNRQRRFLQHLIMKLVGSIQYGSVVLFQRRMSFFLSHRSFATSGLHRIGLAAVTTATLSLSACVESQIPLISDARPLIGQQFEVHLYENFVDGKANDFHASVYRWKDGQYVRASGLARDAKSFVAQLLAANDFLLQSTDENGKRFDYWIGRKLADGVYLIFPLDENDSDDATRNAVCGKDSPDRVCRIKTHDQLVTLARATAAKPVREAALGILVAK